MKKIAALAILAALVTGPVMAADKGDIKALQETKVSLVTAIAAAEKHQGGKAIEWVRETMNSTT